MGDTIKTGFTGAYLDPVTAAYPLGNGYRWYLPGLMRFNAPDTVSPFGAGGINPYAYCVEDPINRIDPMGHVSWGAMLDGLDLEMPRSRIARDLPTADEPITRANSAPPDVDTSRVRRRPLNEWDQGPPAKRFRAGDQPGPSHGQPERQRQNTPPPVDWDIQAHAGYARLHGRLDRLEHQMTELGEPVDPDAHPHTFDSLTLALHNVLGTLEGITGDTGSLVNRLAPRIRDLTANHDTWDRILRDRWGTDAVANAGRVEVDGLSVLARIEGVTSRIRDAERFLAILGPDFTTRRFAA
jgi:RHS repeat-associated protein